MLIVFLWFFSVTHHPNFNRCLRRWLIFVSYFCFVINIFGSQPYTLLYTSARNSRYYLFLAASFIYFLFSLWYYFFLAVFFSQRSSPRNSTTEWWISKWVVARVTPCNCGDYKPRKKKERFQHPTQICSTSYSNILLTSYPFHLTSHKVGCWAPGS